MNEKCGGIVTAADCVTSEILVNTSQEIEYRLVCPGITGVHTKSYFADNKFREVWC